jgi:phosphonate transport system substrate-binding protein
MKERTWGLGFSRVDGVPRSRELVRRASDALSAVSGLTLRPVVTQSYEDLASAVIEGEVAFAWLPPIPAIELQDLGIAEPLCVPVREGDTTYRSALLVRQGAVTKLEELRGRRVAWVSAGSASGYIMPRVYIASEGHDVKRFFGSEVFLGDHRAVVDAVTRGDVDCGATYCSAGADGVVRSGAWLSADGHATRPVHALATFGPIPLDAFVAAASVPAHARLAVTRYLLDGTAEHALTELLDTKTMRIATREHFDAFRHVLRAARARGYAALPPKSRRAIRVL